MPPRCCLAEMDETDRSAAPDQLIVDLMPAEYNIPVVRSRLFAACRGGTRRDADAGANRKVHRAYWRTRDGNFSLHGLDYEFDMRQDGSSRRVSSAPEKSPC